MDTRSDVELPSPRSFLQLSGAYAILHDDWDITANTGVSVAAQRDFQTHLFSSGSHWIVSVQRPAPTTLLHTDLVEMLRRSAGEIPSSPVLNNPAWNDSWELPRDYMIGRRRWSGGCECRRRNSPNDLPKGRAGCSHELVAKLGSWAGWSCQGDRPGLIVCTIFGMFVSTLAECL